MPDHILGMIVADHKCLRLESMHMQIKFSRFIPINIVQSIFSKFKDALSSTLFFGIGLIAVTGIVSCTKSDANHPAYKVVFRPDISDEYMDRLMLAYQKYNLENKEDFISFFDMNPEDIEREDKKLQDEMQYFPNANEIIKISENGVIKYSISDRDYNFTDVKFSKTDEDTLLAASKRCENRSRTKPQLYLYNQVITFSDRTALSGSYEVECYPGTQSQRDELDLDFYVAGILDSEDFDLAERKARAKDMHHWMTWDAFERDFPNPTREQSYNHCLELYRINAEKYLIGSEQDRYGGQPKEQYCEKSYPKQSAQ